MARCTNRLIGKNYGYPQIQTAKQKTGSPGSRRHIFAGGRPVSFLFKKG